MDGLGIVTTETHEFRCPPLLPCAHLTSSGRKQRQQEARQARPPVPLITLLK